MSDQSAAVIQLPTEIVANAASLKGDSKKDRRAAKVAQRPEGEEGAAAAATSGIAASRGGASRGSVSRGGGASRGGGGGRGGATAAVGGGVGGRGGGGGLGVGVGVGVALGVAPPASQTLFPLMRHRPLVSASAPGAGSASRAAALLFELSNLARNFSAASTNSSCAREIDAALAAAVTTANIARPLPASALALARDLRAAISRLPDDGLLGGAIAQAADVMRVDRVAVSHAIAAGLEWGLRKPVLTTSMPQHHMPRPPPSPLTSRLTLSEDDEVVIFGRSVAVEAVIIRAAALARAAGARSPRVTVVASALEAEARGTLTRITAAGVRARTAHFSSAGAVFTPRTTHLLLGAIDVCSDGALVGRAGGAALASLARAAGVRVVVVCEAYKVTERIIVGGDAGAVCADAAPEPVAKVKALPNSGATAVEALASLDWDEVSMSITSGALPPSSSVWVAPLVEVTPSHLIDAFLTEVTPALLHPAALAVLARAAVESKRDHDGDDDDDGEEGEGGDESDESESSS